MMTEIWERAMLMHLMEQADRLWRAQCQIYWVIYVEVSEVHQVQSGKKMNLLHHHSSHHHEEENLGMGLNIMSVRSWSSQSSSSRHASWRS